MKVLLVNGSPHKEGCTYTSLSEAASVLNRKGIDTEFFWIGSKPVGGCHACDKLGKCVFDDIVNECRPKCRKADGFLFGTPVHYAAACGSITGFMDRLFYSELHDSGNATFYMNPAAAVISARRAGTTAAFDQMIKYFAILEMPVVSSRYWNMVHGARPEDVKQDIEGFQTMRVLGRNMAYMPHTDNGLDVCFLLDALTDDRGCTETISRPLTMTTFGRIFAIRRLKLL